jgi:uncharacterized membrane protein YvbJ
MSKSTIVCKSCGTDNEANSEFCIDCGTGLNEIKEVDNDNDAGLSEQEKRRKEYNGWKMSVPYTIGAAIFVTFIDGMTGGGFFDWSYWASVPIILFAVIAPYFSYRMVKE